MTPVVGADPSKCLVPDELGEPAAPLRPSTAHRRFTVWTEAGLWRRLHRAVLDELGARGEVDWTSAIVDASSGRAKKGGSLTGPNPVDRATKGSKLQALSDAHGIPLAVAVSGANMYDSLALKPLIRGIPAVRSRRGPRSRRPVKLRADRRTSPPDTWPGCASAGSSPGNTGSGGIRTRLYRWRRPFPFIHSAARQHLFDAWLSMGVVEDQAFRILGSFDLMCFPVRTPLMGPLTREVVRGPMSPVSSVCGAAAGVGGGTAVPTRAAGGRRVP